jgi:NAD(P)-dependent dehydrogenase (short-subunit alcohol dehydrogenase family)
MGRLDGKVALITGGGRGIGRGTARVMAREGARVVIAELDGQTGQATAEEIRREGGDAHFVPADVGEQAQVEAMVEATIERYGKLTTLVNNAVWTRRGSVVDLDPRDWAKAMDVGMTAVYLGCHYAIPRMLEAGGGSIITISSPHGVLASGENAAYVTMKAAVINLMRNVAIDFGRQGIRANAICPGLIVHEGNRERHDQDPEADGRDAAVFPIGRAGTAEDIGLAALWLASEESSYVTGHALMVDGGLTCQLQDSLADRLMPYFRERFERTGGR